MLTIGKLNTQNSQFLSAIQPTDDGSSSKRQLGYVVLEKLFRDYITAIILRALQNNNRMDRTPPLTFNLHSSYPDMLDEKLPTHTQG